MSNYTSNMMNGHLTPEERRKIVKEQCISLAMEHMGWSRIRARAHLMDAHTRIGISYMDYRRNFFFLIPDEQQEERYREILSAKEFRKQRHSSERVKYISEISATTGWSVSKVRNHVHRAFNISGSTIKDYYAFRFWELSDEEQAEYFTQRRSNFLSAMYDQNVLSRDILLNKELSCIYFSKYLHRAWCINRSVTLEQFRETFADSRKVVYKPLDGNGGHGIEILDLSGDCTSVYEKLQTYPRGVVEAFVVQHPVMASMAPGSVNTLRIVTLAYNDGTGEVAEGEYPVDVAYAAVRIGSGTSSIDNFTEGGFVVGVDLETGTIETDGVTINGIPYEKHPATGVTFKGIVIPFFREALDMVRETGRMIGGYTGWDVAITPTGPVLIEANIMPGNRILQMPYVKARRGMMSRMRKYYGDRWEEALAATMADPEADSEGQAPSAENQPATKGAGIADASRTSEEAPVRPLRKRDTAMAMPGSGFFANDRLSRFEVKGPDYQCIPREHVEMEFARYTPARFVEHKGEWWSFPEETQSRIRLMITGDITCFEKQFEEAATEKGYDFRYEFHRIKGVFSQADLVIGNLETMIFPAAPYRTEKYVSEQNYHCNAPLEFLDALRDAGFDLLTNANNHVLDTGAIGIGETIDHIRQFGMIQTGTFKEKKKRYELINVKGFKIAVTAFATEFNGKLPNLNPEGAAFLLNEYSASRASEILRNAKADGAEYCIACIHWGEENKTSPNRKQQQIAQDLADLGYSCIIGSHPHVLQPFTMLETDRGEVPVFYSMGNFISHNANNPKARSIVACLALTREEGKCVAKVSYVPIFTSNRYKERKYVVLPVREDTISPRNQRVIGRIREVIGTQIPISKALTIGNYIEDRKSGDETGFTPTVPDLSQGFPCTYDNGRFVYSILEDHAVLEHMSPAMDNVSCTVDQEVLNRPLTEMAEGALAGCGHLKKINFGKGILHIPAGVCRDCTALEGFQLGGKTESVGDEAFAGCTALTAAVMRNSVISIGKRAFADCPALCDVKLPPCVTDIAEDAFEGSPNIVIYCEQDSCGEAYAIRNGIPYVNMKL